MEYKKGDRVLVRAIVFTKGWTIDSEIIVKTEPLENTTGKRVYCRNLYRKIIKIPWVGMVVGNTVRKTGHYYPGYNQEYPGKLINVINHPVVMVIPYSTSRWIKPVACLEKDLEPILSSKE